MNVSRPSVLLMVVLVAGIPVAYWMSESARTTIRWLALSWHYKNEVAALPAPQGPYLKHIEWDTWGGFGAGETTMYLVADPRNTLSAILAVPGKVEGIPCKVPEVRRLENGWYTVLFYTDTGWEDCGS